MATSLWLLVVRKYAKVYDYRNEVMSEPQLKVCEKKTMSNVDLLLVPRDIGGKSTRSYVIDTQHLASVLDLSTEDWEEQRIFHHQN